jgi:hypothetical protein
MQFAYPFVIPKPVLSARNLLAAGSETADSSSGKPRFGMTILLGNSTAPRMPFVTYGWCLFVVAQIEAEGTGRAASKYSS